MSTEIRTIAQLLGYSTKGLSKRQVDELNELDEYKQVRNKLVETSPLMVDIAPRSIWDALSGALEIELVNVVGWAWNTRRELYAYCDPAKHSPEEVINHILLKQEIEWARKPRLCIYFDENIVGEIEFTVGLTLAIDGGILEIRNGRIMSGSVGKCRGQGTLKCDKAILLAPETKDFEIPGTFSFGEGLPIKPPPRAALHADSG